METLTRTITVAVKADNVEDCESIADSIQLAATQAAKPSGSVVLFEDDAWADEEE